MIHIVTGGIMHETHTFSQEPSQWEVFGIVEGAEYNSFAGTNTSAGGVIDACQELGLQLTPTFHSHATSTATIPSNVFERMMSKILEGIKAALPVDGVILTQHGAMVVEGAVEGDAEVVRRVRQLVGPDVPIAVTLDFHANIGPNLVGAADLIVGYNTYPHIDLNKRAREAVHLLVQMINGEIKPTMALAKPPLMPVPQAQYTSEHPFRTILDRADQMLKEPDVLSITVAGGFAYSDGPVTGSGFIVTTNANPTLATSLANELAEVAWNNRDAMIIDNTPPDQAVAEGMAYPEGPVILVDVGDNIGGGTPGDGTVLLHELLRQGASNAVVIIADKEAVEAAFAAGVGATVTTTVGGKVDNLHGSPVPVTGRVVMLSDGEWVHEGPENAGVTARPGRTAVLKVDGVKIVLNTVKTAPGDQQQLRSVGIDPTRTKIICVKAAVRWRGGYGPIMKHAIHVDTPGLGSVNLDNFTFHEIPRPIFPIDRGTTWRKEDSELG